ncbi:transmembrane protein [Gigaspora margarita]|uniref:Transmembrane protein n=1 Tax=Gigaspora margarita TaxID=4874 RepID=A0A8H4ADR0_GIGMA|nr:transmembrane protein [Gigaspora margarita]
MDEIDEIDDGGDLLTNLSLAVPITNSLTFIFTALAGSLLGEQAGTKETWIGMIFVIIGVGLCVGSKV